MVKLELIKQSLLQILYLEQQSNIPRCFFSLKIGKTVHLPIIFSVLYLAVRFIQLKVLYLAVRCIQLKENHTVEKDQIKYFYTTSDRIHHLNIRKRKP